MTGAPCSPRVELFTAGPGAVQVRALVWLHAGRQHLGRVVLQRAALRARQHGHAARQAEVRHLQPVRKPGSQARQH